jgi:hypothetical protein
MGMSGRKTFFSLLPVSASGRANAQLLEISKPVGFSLFQPETLSKIFGVAYSVEETAAGKG